MKGKSYPTDVTCNSCGAEWSTTNPHFELVNCPECASNESLSFVEYYKGDTNGHQESASGYRG